MAKDPNFDFICANVPLMTILTTRRPLSTGFLLLWKVTSAAERNLKPFFLIASDRPGDSRHGPLVLAEVARCGAGY
jgi:hypothetical protein